MPGEWQLPGQSPPPSPRPPSPPGSVPQGRKASSGTTSWAADARYVSAKRAGAKAGLVSSCRRTRGSAGPGRLARTPAVTSGLCRRRAGGQDAADAARLTFCGLSPLAQPRAGRQGLQPGAPPGEPSEASPGPPLHPRKVRRRPGSSPRAFRSGWAAAEGGCAGTGAAFPRGGGRGRECELSLFPYNKSVAWGGNLPRLSGDSCWPRERTVLILGAPPPPEGLGQGRAGGPGQRPAARG